MRKRRTDRHNFEDIAETARIMLTEGKTVKEIAEAVGWTVASLRSSLINRGFILQKKKGEKLSDEQRYAGARMTHIYTVHFNRSDYENGYHFEKFFKTYKRNVVIDLEHYFRSKRYIVEFQGVTSRITFDRNSKKDIMTNICVYSFEECPTLSEIEKFHRAAIRMAV